MNLYGLPVSSAGPVAGGKEPVSYVILSGSSYMNEHPSMSPAKLPKRLRTHIENRCFSIKNSS